MAAACTFQQAFDTSKQEYHLQFGQQGSIASDYDPPHPGSSFAHGSGHLDRAGHAVAPVAEI